MKLREMCATNGSISSSTFPSSRTKEGRIDAWLNKKKIVDYIGINAYPPSGGYPDQNQFYFKTGLYRDKADQPVTLYFDEYRKNLVSKVSDSP